jgi:hypothetical protein
MKREVSPQSVQTLAHLYRHWEERRQLETTRAGQAVPTTVALSREAGTNGPAVAEEIGRLLVWPVYDHQLLERIARDRNVRVGLLETVDEKRGNWFEETVERAVGVPLVSHTAYVRYLVKTILALGSHGECIIVGRGAGFLLPPESTLRVRLTAPLPYRTLNLSRTRTLALPMAAREVQRMDHERNAFVRGHFFKDPADLGHYDLVVDVSRFGVKGSAALIVTGLHLFDAQRAEGRLPPPGHPSQQSIAAGSAE